MTYSHYIYCRINHNMQYLLRCHTCTGWERILEPHPLGSSIREGEASFLCLTVKELSIMQPALSPQALLGRTKHSTEVFDL